jgi:hypothetical protein
MELDHSLGALLVDLGKLRSVSALRVLSELLRCSH